MAHGRGIYMCDSPGRCFEYGKILILSRVLCSSPAGDTLKVPDPGFSSTIYVIKKVENILPYCVINKHQTLGNGASTSNQPPVIPAHHPILKLVVAQLTEKQKQVVSETKKKQWVSFRDKTNMVISLN